MKLFLVAVFIFVCIFSPFTYAEDNVNDINIILANLEKKMSGLNNIQTDFIQEKKMAVFDKKIILRGKIFIQAPDLFSWHTNEPVRYIMVIKGNTVKQWDEDSKQVQVISLARNPTFLVAVNQMKTWFGGHYSQLLHDYEARVISSKPIILEFMPKKSVAGFNAIKRVRITFRADERYVERIDIEENNLDSASLTFLNTKFNTPIDSASWELK